MDTPESPRTPILSRRRFLEGTALAGLGAFLAACVPGAQSTSGPTAASPSAVATESAGASAAGSVAPSASSAPPAITGPLKFANWTAYIDLAGNLDAYKPGSSPTIEAFKKKYSVDVDYEEKINDSPSFVETIKPALVGGLPTGWDLIVLTDWMAAKIVASKWAEQIDQGHVPNCTANLRDPLRNQAWDPNNDYHYPWQSGMTGVGYNTKALANNKIAPPTKIADLWAIPSDKVTFLTESRDTFGLGLLKLGIDADPAKVSVDDIHHVRDDIKPLVDKGLRFTGNDYLQDFGQKKVWAAMVWSGDLASSAGPDDKFVFPDEGTMIWTDNMLIPKGAANKYTAELMMNFVYDPKIAAQLAAGIFYVSPVKGADEELKKIDAALATNPLMFPPADVIAKQRNFQFLSDDLEKALNDDYSSLSGT